LSYFECKRHLQLVENENLTFWSSWKK